MSNNQRVKIDIVLCGDVRVGKTSFVLRATGKKVSKKYIQTIGIDYGVYRCYTGGKNVTLNMWDMSGDSRYDLIAKSFFERAQCILYWFDFTRETTFQKIKQLVDKADDPSDSAMAAANSASSSMNQQSRLPPLATLLRLLRWSRH